jgi:hypothetical protein
VSGLIIKFKEIVMAALDRKSQINAIKFPHTAGSSLDGDYIVIEDPESLSSDTTNDKTSVTNIRGVIRKSVVKGEVVITGLEFEIDPDHPLFPLWVELEYTENIPRIPTVQAWLDENDEFIPTAGKVKMSDISITNSGGDGSGKLKVTVDIDPSGRTFPVDDVELNVVTDPSVRSYETVTVTMP